MKTLFQVLLSLLFISFGACNQCTDSPTDNPDNSPSGAELYYNYYIDKDNMQVFRCNADGSGQRLFSTTSGIISSLYNITSSPQKGKILLATQTTQDEVNLVIANTDGSDAKVIPNAKTDWHPVLSPTGASILCSNKILQANASAISIVNTDGTNLKQLADDMQRESTPSFSRAGDKVAYYTHNDELAIVNTDGTGKTILASNAAAYADNSAFLSWSPDGQEIVCMMRNAILNDYTDVVVINVSTKEKRIIHSSDKITSGQPQWSPDGKSIVYIRGERDEGLVDTEVVVCNPDGTNEKVIFNQTQPPLFALLPQWSPDSKKISITVSDNRNMRPGDYKSIRVIDLSTGNVSLLGNNMIFAYWAY